MIIVGSHCEIKNKDGKAAMDIIGEKYNNPLFMMKAMQCLKTAPQQMDFLQK